MPPNMPPIFPCASSSTFFAASLNAAIIMSCNISTSPATSGSILTPRTFFWPSILTETMPPPADASTRIAAISSCSFCCICWACFIMDCMLPGIFIVSLVLFIQISHGTNVSAREQFLKPLHAGMGQCTLCHVIVNRHLRFLPLGTGGGAAGSRHVCVDFNAHFHGPPKQRGRRPGDRSIFQPKQEGLCRCEHDLRAVRPHVRMLNGVGAHLHPQLRERGM